MLLSSVLTGPFPQMERFWVTVRDKDHSRYISFQCQLFSTIFYHSNAIAKILMHHMTNQYKLGYSLPHPQVRREMWIFRFFASCRGTRDVLHPSHYQSPDNEVWQCSHCIATNHFRTSLMACTSSWPHDLPEFQLILKITLHDVT